MTGELHMNLTGLRTSDSKIKYRMWSFYVGRPESLDQKHITVSMPTADEVAQGGQATWKPYCDEFQSPDSSEIPGLLGEATQYTVTLCVRMSEIRRVLYVSIYRSAVGLESNQDRYTTPEASGGDVKQLYSSARRMKADLLGWAECLPKPLALDLKDFQTRQPPHILQLQYGPPQS